MKCRHCGKRYVDMLTPYTGHCPLCKAVHTISVRVPLGVAQPNKDYGDEE